MNRRRNVLREIAQEDMAWAWDTRQWNPMPTRQELIAECANVRSGAVRTPDDDRWTVEIGHQKELAKMEVVIKGGKMVVTIDVTEARMSSTGKTMIVASTGGFTGTTATVNGKPVSVNLTATIKP